VPESEDLDRSSGFVDPVINQDRRMQGFANFRTTRHRRAEFGKPLQQTDVIENGVTKTLRRFGKTNPGVFENFFEIS
jgi:hypothetical protein